MQMQSKDFDELLLTLVHAGLEVSLELNEDNYLEFAYKISTGAKSDMVISKAQGALCKYKKRYNETGICEDYMDFLYTLKSCLCGRDYANNAFFELLVKEGIMQKATSTTYY